MGRLRLYRRTPGVGHGARPGGHIYDRGVGPHALSDPTRARLLLASRDGSAYPADLAELLGVSRQNLSNHLACLRGCGLVVAVPEVRRSRHELADARLAHALGDLLGVVIAVDPTVSPTSDDQECC
jgi:ArsR family transcriptional regulator, cadmium/lead-responsive transcriptional repressor